MAKPGVGWGVPSQHMLDLPEAHQHYCNEHDPERHGAQEGMQRGEPKPSSVPCTGVASGAERLHAGRGGQQRTSRLQHLTENACHWCRTVLYSALI